VQGLLVSPGDPAALAAALTTVSSDADLRMRMGQAARERATAYDIRNAVVEQERMYAALARRR
jgi:glycosyltransferase involved in cell wall biosynthesis